jgi:hypothetical protein
MGPRSGTDSPDCRAFYAGDTIRKYREFDKLIDTDSKAKFVQNQDRIEYLAWLLSRALKRKCRKEEGVQGMDAETARQQCLQEHKSEEIKQAYVIPKSKDELKELRELASLEYNTLDALQISKDEEGV